MEEYPFEPFPKPTVQTVVQHILMASYCYYQLAEEMFTDAHYDKLTKYCARNWEAIEHRHKHLIKHDKNANNVAVILKEGDYPEIVKSSAEGFLKKKREYYKKKHLKSAEDDDKLFTTFEERAEILEKTRISVTVEEKDREIPKKSLWDI